MSQYPNQQVLTRNSYSCLSIPPHSRMPFLNPFISLVLPYRTILSILNNIHLHPFYSSVFCFISFFLPFPISTHYLTYYPPFPFPPFLHKNFSSSHISQYLFLFISKLPMPIYHYLILYCNFHLFQVFLLDYLL